MKTFHCSFQKRDISMEVFDKNITEYGNSFEKMIYTIMTGISTTRKK